MAHVFFTSNFSRCFAGAAHPNFTVGGLLALGGWREVGLRVE